jgi:hypothetical protein
MKNARYKVFDSFRNATSGKWHIIILSILQDSPLTKKKELINTRIIFIVYNSLASVSLLKNVKTNGNEMTEMKE